MREATDYSYEQKRAWVCTRKQRYKTKKIAQHHQGLAKRYTKVKLNVYKCEFCRGYHLGHQKQEFNGINRDIDRRRYFAQLKKNMELQGYTEDNQQHKPNHYRPKDKRTNT